MSRLSKVAEECANLYKKAGLKSIINPAEKIIGPIVKPLDRKMMKHPLTNYPLKVGKSVTNVADKIRSLN